MCRWRLSSLDHDTDWLKSLSFEVRVENVRAVMCVLTRAWNGGEEPGSWVYPDDLMMYLVGRITYRPIYSMDKNKNKYVMYRSGRWFKVGMFGQAQQQLV
jgi:hypothetical protein